MGISVGGCLVSFEMVGFVEDVGFLTFFKGSLQCGYQRPIARPAFTLVLNGESLLFVFFGPE